MGRSRKKAADSAEQQKKRKIRRKVWFLFILAFLTGMILVFILFSAVPKKRWEKPQLAASLEEAEKIKENEAEREAAKEEIEKEETEASVAAELILEPDNQEYHYDFGTSILKQDEVPEINQLMEQYFMSVSDCDMATFQQLFVSQDISAEEEFRQKFEQQRQYIDGYQNISCYTVSGIRENELAVYVYYEICYTGVDTAAPSLVRIYAVKGEDGCYRIYDQDVSDELETYLEQLSWNEDVRLLSLQVDQKLEQEMEQDPALRERVEFLKQGALYMQAEGEAEEKE